MYTHEPILFNIEKLARVYFRQNQDLAFPVYSVWNFGVAGWS
jgi:hypothetical protein